MKNIFIVVKDEEGKLRPQAGIWRDNESGKISSNNYLEKNPEIELVKVEMIGISVSD